LIFSLSHFVFFVTPNLSLKAIKKLLPFLEQGFVYSKKDADTGELGALQAAGYQEEIAENKKTESLDKLPAPQETSERLEWLGSNSIKHNLIAVCLSKSQ
jgi:hypothetical protein